MRIYGVPASFAWMGPHLQMLLPLLVIELSRISMAAASGALKAPGVASHAPKLKCPGTPYFAAGVVLPTKFSKGL
jgi:hypothetical protein